MENTCACVILNYNDWRTTKKLVQQISDYPSIGQIIIVDNSSSDDSYEQLKQIEADKATVIQTERNGGYGYGNNFGIRFAKSKGFRYVLLSNPDVNFSEEFVKTMIQSAQSKQNLAIVSGIQLNISRERIRPFAWKIPTIYEACIYPTKYAYRKKITLYDDAHFQEGDLCFVDCVPGALLLIDVNMFLDVGGYDERMFLYCEETTIGIRLRDAGYRTAILPSETYVHEHAVSISKSIKSESKQARMIAKNRLFIMKNYLHASRFEMFVASCIYKFCLIKGRVKGKIKRIIRK